MRVHLIGLVFFLSISFPSLADPLPTSNRVTREEAQVFCKQVWFPELALGSGFTQEKVEQQLDRLLTLYTPQAQLIDPNNQDLFGKPILKGPEEIRNYYRSVLTRYPEWEFEIRAIYPTEKGFILHYTGRKAPPVKEFDGVDILEIKRGPAGSGPQAFQIEKLQEFYDRLPFTQGP